MNYRSISSAVLIAAAITGCSGDPDVFEPELVEDELGTLQAALGESTCGGATPTTSTSGLVTMAIAAEDQDNPACRWGYVHQVNNVAAGTYFFTKWNDNIPLNDINCAASNVSMYVYKLTSSGWTLDAERVDHGNWRDGACGVANVNRQVRSSGHYKLVVNGSYSGLSARFRSDVRVNSMRASL